MAIAAYRLRIGQRLEGRCGRLAFAGRVTQINSVTVVITGDDRREQEVCTIWCDPLTVNGKLTPT